MPRCRKVFKKVKRIPPHLRSPKPDADGGEADSTSTRSSSSGISSSGKKLFTGLVDYDNYSSSDDCYDIINIKDYSEFLCQFMRCFRCQGKMTFSYGKRVGLATTVTLNCTGDGDCLVGRDYTNSKKPIGEVGNDNLYEYNLRLAYGMRSIGQVEAGAQTFCAVMNLPSPFARFTAYDEVLGKAANEISEASMEVAREEAVVINEDCKDIPAAFDGSWQKRGFSSMNGLVSCTSVDTGKVLDIACYSKYCLCPRRLKNIHNEDCRANYSGSSGGMEVQGAKDIFERSKSRNVRYTKYLGDGDFKAVVDSKPYGPDVDISKLECIGHVQKRMGSRLRQIRSKGGTLSDGKSLKGHNRFTEKVVDQIQVYYGNAIRSSVSNLEDMKKAVWAVYFHLGSTDEHPDHGLCPSGEDSWCKFNKAIAVNQEYKHKEHSHIDPVIMNHIKPVFRDLAHPDLLKKCLHGKTQNVCESLNNLVWCRLPKRVFIQLTRMKLGVSEALACYNDGCIAKCRILKKIGIIPGTQCVEALRKIDLKRVKEANRAAYNMTKMARQKRSSARKNLEDIFEAAEGGPAYAAGAH